MSTFDPSDNLSIVESDLNWWRAKVRRRGSQCFNPSIGAWAVETLDSILEQGTVEVTSGSLKELATSLEVPLKYLSRSIATLTRCGLVAADLKHEPELFLQLDTFGKRKGAAQIKRDRIPARMRRYLFGLESHTCAHCKQVYGGADLHVDHIVPVSLLGADEPGNWVTMCRNCNAAKLDKFERDYLRLFRGHKVREPIRLRFRSGWFWPVVNGRVQRATRQEWEALDI